MVPHDGESLSRLERGRRDKQFFCAARRRSEDVESELAKARAYKFQARIRWKGETTATVYARNHSFAVGQPASFDVQDIAPSALEYLLGSLGGCLVMGLADSCFARRCED